MLSGILTKLGFRIKSRDQQIHENVHINQRQTNSMKQSPFGNVDSRRAS
jgi:hypothetical protein